MNIKQISLLSTLVAGIVVGNAHANQIQIALLSSCFSNIIKNVIPSKNKTVETSETTESKNDTQSIKSTVRLTRQPGGYYLSAPEIGLCPGSVNSTIVIKNDNIMTIKTFEELYQENQQDQEDLSYINLSPAHLTACPLYRVITMGSEKKETDYQICTDETIEKAVIEFYEKQKNERVVR